MCVWFKGGALPLFISMCFYFQSASGIRSMSSGVPRAQLRELCGGFEFCGRDERCRPCHDNNRCVRDSARQWLCTSPQSWLSAESLLSSVFQAPTQQSSARLLQEQSGCSLSKQATVSSRSDLVEIGEVCGGRCFEDDNSCNNWQFINKQGACCPEGKFCWPASEYHWFCKAPKLVESEPGKCAPAGGRCGGKIECFEYNMITGLFETFNKSCRSCETGYACTYIGSEYEWTCQLPSFAYDGSPELSTGASPSLFDLSPEMSPEIGESPTADSSPPGDTLGGFNVPEDMGASPDFRLSPDVSPSPDDTQNSFNASEGSTGNTIKCELSEMAQLERGMEEQGEVCGGTCYLTEDGSCSKAEFANKQAACCPADKFCWPASEWHWFCKGPAPQPQGQCAPAGGRCGGKLECVKPDPNSPTGFQMFNESCGCCTSGYECTFQDEFEWLCLLPGAQAPPGGSDTVSGTSVGPYQFLTVDNGTSVSGTSGNLTDSTAPTNSTNVSGSEVAPEPEAAPEVTPEVCSLSDKAEVEVGQEEQGEVCGGRCYKDGTCNNLDFVNKQAACCPDDKYCWPASEWHWFCKAPKPQPEAGQCAPAGGRCGGKLECFIPDSESLTGFKLLDEACGCCSDGNECIKGNEWEWFCLPPGTSLNSTTDAALNASMNSTSSTGLDSLLNLLANSSAPGNIWSLLTNGTGESPVVDDPTASPSPLPQDLSQSPPIVDSLASPPPVVDSLASPPSVVDSLASPPPSEGSPPPSPQNLVLSVNDDSAQASPVLDGAVSPSPVEEAQAGFSVEDSSGVNETTWSPVAPLDAAVASPSPVDLQAGPSPPAEGGR